MTVRLAYCWTSRDKGLPEIAAIEDGECRSCGEVLKEGWDDPGKALETHMPADQESFRDMLFGLEAMLSAINSNLTPEEAFALTHEQVVELWFLLTMAEQGLSGIEDRMNPY